MLHVKQGRERNNDIIPALVCAWVAEQFGVADSWKRVAALAPIPASQPRAFVLSLVEGELLAQGETLKHKGLCPARKANQAKQARQEGEHGRPLFALAG